MTNKGRLKALIFNRTGIIPKNNVRDTFLERVIKAQSKRAFVLSDLERSEIKARAIYKRNKKGKV